MNSDELSKTNIHWYPGHMKQASNALIEKAKMADFVIIVLDSRAPYSTINNFFLRLFDNKPRLFILNKIDLADKEQTHKWAKFLTKDGMRAIEVNSKINIIKSVANELDILLKEKREKAKKRGIVNPLFKGIIVGVPNVGKSTIINNFLKKKQVQAANKAGVTKTVSWIKISSSLFIMDTPGILAPKYDDKKTAINLALIGSVREEILPNDDLAEFAVMFLLTYYKKEFEQYLNQPLDTENEERIYEIIAIRYGLLKSRGELDRDAAIKRLLKDFKESKVAPYTLDRVEDYVKLWGSILFR